MIEVRHLTKYYGGRAAIKDISFTVEKGTICGFLGPNGAGKSTTMNILTGCLGPSEGDVKIDGADMLEEPEKAKKKIGYLPEVPPLYPDMTVEEYLRFAAELKGLHGKEAERQVRSVMARTATEEVKDRLIKNLSKGYRQRVGIAQALLADPEIVILDEPTVGLDPAQIIEIRELIRELGKDHTVVLSSHILSEVQAVCGFIMILSRGRLVASDTAENLTKRLAEGDAVKVLTGSDRDAAAQALREVPGVVRVEDCGDEDGKAAFMVSAAGGADVREAISAAFAQKGLALTELYRTKASLEDVFLELTQDQGEGGEDGPAGDEKAEDEEARGA